MNYDEYGEVINGKETFEKTAYQLGTDMEPVLLGWTDEKGTHFDILLQLGARAYGNNIQGGIRPKRDLFVSIMRHGAFAFDPDNKETHFGYYEEKLGNMGIDCAVKFGELINGIKNHL